MSTTDDLGEKAVTREFAVQPWALVLALRPQQWVKNGLVFLPLVFAINVPNLDPSPRLILELVVVFLAFCATSGAIYLLNDIMDREMDRLHPIKRDRPIASGKLKVPVAIGAMFVLGAVGLAAMGVVEPKLAGIGLLYVVINVAYSLGV